MLSLLMAQALIRKLGEETLADYRAEAAAKGTSLEAELRHVIENNRPRRRLSAAELIALSQELTGSGPKTRDSTPYFRWMRDTDAGRYIGRKKPNADRR